jgi:hypothetical protein
MKRTEALTQRFSLALLGTGLALGVVLQAIQILRGAGMAG